MIHPTAFIRAAEESGLIVEVGRWVLEQVARDAPLLVAAAGRPLAFSVNMSTPQLRDPAFVADIRRAVAALGTSPFIVEMTEAVVLNADAQVSKAIRDLKIAGARLAIDDFGVGISSIGNLQNLALDVIKIDPSFTREIASDPRAAGLVRAVLGMAGALDVEVVAEGVESRAQAELLRAGGCAAGQGFFFGRPAPLADVIGSLQTTATAVPLPRREVQPSPTGATRPSAGPPDGEQE